MKGHALTVSSVNPQVCLRRSPVFGSVIAGVSGPAGITEVQVAVDEVTVDDAGDNEDGVKAFARLVVDIVPDKDSPTHELAAEEFDGAAAC